MAVVPFRNKAGSASFGAPEPDLLDDLSPPEFLSGEKARRVWCYLAPKLRDARMLTVIDTLSLVALCEDVAECVQAQQVISDMLKAGQMPIVKGKGEGGGWNYHPAFVLRNKAAERISAGATAFGMTPLARTKIRTQQQLDLFADGDSSIAALVEAVRGA